MNKIIKFAQSYLIVGLPIVVIFLGLSAFKDSGGLIDYAINHYKTFWMIIGFLLMSWFLVLFLFLVSLVLMPSVRERTLKQLANLKERDEREEYITGKASRSAYISTLSVMIFLLFLSMFSVSIYKLPPDKLPKDGHRYTLNMGFQYEMFNKSENNHNSEGTAIFDSRNIFPSTATIIFILLGWQLLAFNMSARREAEK